MIEPSTTKLTPETTPLVLHINLDFMLQSVIQAKLTSLTKQPALQCAPGVVGM